MTEQKALVIFAKLPRAGEVKTRLGSVAGMERAANIYGEFAQHAFSVGREVSTNGTKVCVFYDPSSDEKDMREWVGEGFDFAPQEGDNLGERMRNAFLRTLRGGATRSIIIGTDVPELTAATVLEGFTHLRSNDVVLGPSTDGGYYLLGMNGPVKDVFDRIPWSTGTVFSETLSRLRTLKLTHALLEELADVDTIEDYNAYRVRKGSA